MDRWRNEWGGREGGGGCYLPSNLLLPFKSNQALPFCGAPLHSGLGWFSPPCPPHWAHHTNSATCCSPLFWSQPHLCRVSIGTGISNKGWLWLYLTALYNPISLMSFHPCALLCITFTFVLQIRKLRLRAAAQMITGRAWIWIHDVCLQSPYSTAFVSSSSGWWELVRHQLLPNEWNLRTHLTSSLSSLLFELISIIYNINIIYNIICNII